MKPLQRPPLLNKPCSQIIEQFGKNNFKDNIRPNFLLADIFSLGLTLLSALTLDIINNRLEINEIAFRR